MSQRRGHISSCLCRNPVSQNCRCRARTACGRLSLWVFWLPAVTWTCCWGEYGECSPPSMGSGESTQLGWGLARVSRVGNQHLVELTSGFSFLFPVSDCVKIGSACHITLVFLISGLKYPLVLCLLLTFTFLSPTLLSLPAGVLNFCCQSEK